MTLFEVQNSLKFQNIALKYPLVYYYYANASSYISTLYHIGSLSNNTRKRNERSKRSLLIGLLDDTILHSRKNYDGLNHKIGEILPDSLKNRGKS